MTPISLEKHHSAAREVLHEMQLTEVEQHHPKVSGHGSSLPLLAKNHAGQQFLLKYYVPPPPDKVLPYGVRAEDYSRRESGFYRLLDSIEPSRRDFPAPRTIAVGPGDPAPWLLLEWLPAAPGPAEEVISQDHVLDLLRKASSLPTDRLMGRRGFPLEHWDPVGYLDRIRNMYDAVLFSIGENRWRMLQRFFGEAVRWTDSRPHVMVHGDFQEANIIVTDEDRAFLIDFECVGIGNPDHDFAWYWIHSDRHPEWKRNLLHRWLGDHVGGDRIRSEWGIRSAIAYIATCRLRWEYLTHGDEAPRLSANLALLDAALEGGTALFPL